ncbi:MAG TPA: hypothetical protein PKE47_09770 [Verrucomicrobiota bacterium]|nr:hypothetical protein [Verrucomicrobiota bacterium]
MNDPVVILVEAALWLAAAHAAAGLVFAVVLHAKGLGRLDPAVRGGGAVFRLLITPGLVVLWPVLLHRWRRAARGGEFAGRPDAPLRPRRLRRMHRLAWQLLAAVIPLMAGVALAWRPAPAPPQVLPLVVPVR